MNKEYICTGCGALYTIEDLEDNYDGTCFYCDCPLVLLEKGKTFSYLHPLNEENIEVNKIINELQHCSIDSIWHNIEKLKDQKTRLKFRGYFFKALKASGKSFELWED